jgi:uroporphyrinogen decarboxylase
VLKTLQFEPVDRVPFDLMEGAVWPELLDYFRDQYHIENAGQVIEFLDPDFRWTFLVYQGPNPDEQPAASLPDKAKTFSKAVVEGPLTHAESLSDLNAYPLPDPAWFVPADYAPIRAHFPDKALVFCPGWMPLFWTACEAFGMQAAMVKMVTQPEIFDGFIQRFHEFCMDILSRGASGARGYCDLALLGDDFASQQAMLISPSLWRKLIKPYLAEQVRVLRENDLYVLFHSCGAVREILPDLIEIGVNALLVFQTTARGMDAPSIAREFGGRLAFYGGIDVQQLLSFGSPQQVEAEVCSNVRAFAEYGGYIVANSHHTIATIRGENVIAMCDAARKCVIK